LDIIDQKGFQTGIHEDHHLKERGLRVAERAIANTGQVDATQQTKSMIIMNWNGFDTKGEPSPGTFHQTHHPAFETRIIKS